RAPRDLPDSRRGQGCADPRRAAAGRAAPGLQDGAGGAPVPAPDRPRRGLRLPRPEVPLAAALRPWQQPAGRGDDPALRPGRRRLTRRLAPPPGACDDARPMKHPHATVLVLTAARMAAGMTSRARRPESRRTAG